MKAIILSAGKGERLRPLTNAIPKPMLPIAGKPILEYLILLCKKHGITEIVINTSFLPEQIKKYFGDGSKFGVKINYSFESELLGTSGALNNFRDFFQGDEPFFVLYGDNITDVDLTAMLKYHKEKQAFGTMFLYHETMILDPKATPGKTIINDNNQVIEIIEKPNEQEKQKLSTIPENKQFTNSGIYILEPEVLDLIPQGYSDFAKDILPQILEKGKLYGFLGDYYIRELGLIPRYEKGKQHIESGEIKLSYIN